MGESICSPGPLSIITHSSYLRTACLPCWRARGAKAGNGRWRRPGRRLRWCSIGSGPKYMICVTLFCTLRESENTQTCENRTRFACDSRMSVC